MSPPPIITTIVKDVGIGAFLLTALVVPQMLFGGIVFGVLLVSFVIRAGLAYFQAE